ncbi:MAG: ACP phosphodiesterase [Flavobacteriales bacterium]
MNFLAHIALSGNDEEIAIGNFIADTILPKERNLLSDKMMRGVKLHHAIDTFTDSHSSFIRTTQLSRSLLKKYAPVATDVFFDHFLALHFEKYFPGTTLDIFSTDFYASLQKHNDALPERAQILIHHLIKNDWLKMYRTVDGLNIILTQMSKRTRFESNLDKATEVLREHYTTIEEDFSLLFPELIQLSRNFNFD